MAEPMPPDDPNGYETDLLVMRRDAKNWDEASAQLGEAATLASGLKLDEAAFSLIGSSTGLITAYTDFRNWVVGVLEDGQTNFANLSKTLRSAANDYEAEESSGAQRMNQIDPGGS